MQVAIFLRSIEPHGYAATVSEIVQPSRLDPAPYRMCYDTPRRDSPEEAEADARAFCEWRGCRIESIFANGTGVRT